MHAGVNVVEIQRMPEDAVDESRFGHRSGGVRTPDGGLPARTEAANVAQRDLADLIEPPCQRHAERVDEGIAGSVHDIPR